MKLFAKISAFCLAVLVVASVMSSCKKEYTTIKGDPTNTRIYTLDNGLTVYLTPIKKEPRIQTYIAVRVGSKNDPSETTGLSHYLEHIMFKGTTNYGTTNYEAEKPLLDQITEEFEKYRTLTDPEERKAQYAKIDSISYAASEYFIGNEYDKIMAQMGA
ncbi:MAG: insulinase family protein, partial [Bacteroidales bacterium]|nr:insulinase family protein [Bacteroidales bacterium]